MTRAFWLLLLVPALAQAQAATRYNEAAASPPAPPLLLRVDKLAEEMAKKVHRPPPRRDPRLDAAALDIMRLMPEGAPPANELLQGAMWVHGIVEPPPHLILSSMSRGGEEALLRTLAGDLANVLAQGRYARIGVAIVAAANETEVLVALQESFLELEPVARTLPLDAGVELRGKLAGGFAKPEAFVTTPDGKVLTRMALGGRAPGFDGRFRCGPERGRYQVEVTAEDKLGATVLANFPIWCGATAPTTAQGSAPAGAGADAAPGTPAQAERAVWKLLNADRARAGLPALAWDDALAAVARAHSADMEAHNFFGHVSPTTGSAADRTRRAHVDAMLILENLARAFNPGEVERGLMNSPGHRANILNREATRVGVGVVADPASHDLLVTQLFSRPPETFDAGTIATVRRQLAVERHAARQPALEHDAELDELAQSTAHLMVVSHMSPTQAGHRVEQALSKQPGRWHAARTAFATVSAGSQVAGALRQTLADPSVTHLGVGIEPGKRPDGGSALWVVIILATLR